MSEEAKEQKEQQRGGISPSISLGDESSNNDEVAKLQAELHKSQVEQGRVKKLAGENKEYEAEVERLRKENEALKQAQLDPTNYVDPALREVIDEDILRANNEMIQGSSKHVLEEVDKRLGPVQQALEAEKAARVQAERSSMDSRIEQMHPGFAAATQTGGKHAESWAEYLGRIDPRTGLRNGDILVSAYNGHRVEGVNNIIDQFKADSGISGVERMQGSAFPGGQTPFVEQGIPDKGEVYTISQYRKALAESRQAHAAGRQTNAERSAILKKYSTALQEGRIVNDPAPDVGV